MMNIGSVLIAGRTYLRQLDSVSGPLAVATAVAIGAFSSQWWVVPLALFWVWYTFAEGMSAGIALKARGDREQMLSMLTKMLKDTVEQAKKEGIAIELEGLEEALDSCAIKQRCHKTGAGKACGNCNRADPDKVVEVLRKAQHVVEVKMKMNERKARGDARKAANQAHVDAGGELDLPPLDEDFFGRM